MNTEDVSALQAFGGFWRSMGYSPTTGENYCRELRLLAARQPLASATTMDLHAFLAERSEIVGPATLAVTVRALRAFYKWRAGALDTDDPARNLRSPKVPETPIRSVNEHEYRQLLASITGNEIIDVRDRALIAVLWSSGMRRSEVARMRLEDIDLAEGTISVPRTKTGKPRTCGLSLEAVKLLRAYLKMRFGKQSHSLWIGRKGQPLESNGIGQLMERRCREAGMRQISPHEFRRSIAERWLAAGGSESLLRYHAGWSSPTMVARYVRANAQGLALHEHRRILG